ncbi:hypothetical protein HSBAA_65080 [Vreelandella sulfidaeris]|uniref:Uncharacterized protein n=1 Tax=Vreelandella sulfidaeris TaxID=115553 RepID=A0A455UFY1_9GAMM|nr:hypothetical protein HSBAA_65080 [Halomonas sulfidaeris]
MGLTHASIAISLNTGALATHRPTILITVMIASAAINNPPLIAATLQGISRLRRINVVPMVGAVAKLLIV